MGDYPGAITDFEHFVNWAKETGLDEAPIRTRETWIGDLRAGQNPFDAQTLEALRTEVVEGPPGVAGANVENPAATPAASPAASTPSANGSKH